MKTQGKLEPGPGPCLIFQEGLHRTHGRPGWGGEGDDSRVREALLAREVGAQSCQVLSIQVRITREFRLGS